MFLIIYTDGETSDLGRISKPFTSRPTLEDVQEWDGPTLENDGNCTSCTWTIVDCKHGQEVGSITITSEGEVWRLGCLK